CGMALHGGKSRTSINDLIDRLLIDWSKVEPISAPLAGLGVHDLPTVRAHETPADHTEGRRESEAAARMGGKWRALRRSAARPATTGTRRFSRRRPLASEGHGRFGEAGPERYAGRDRAVVEVVPRVMDPGRIAVADEDERAGTRLQHEREILPAH